jgi:ribonuclease D
VLRARDLGDDELPEVTGPATIPGPPPAHRWSERDPDAAARLAAAREAVTAVAEAHRLPTENLLAPDTVRRITWEPPQPATPETVAAALAGYGARPWQVELTAGPLATAFRAAAAAPPPGPDGTDGPAEAEGQPGLR